MIKTTGHKAALAAAAVLALGACATSTTYAPANERSAYGFSEQRIENDRFRITFRGNSSTTRETVETYLLYRAAELTLENGYDHFVVVEDETERSTSYRGTTDPFGYGPGGAFGYYGFGRPFPYYGYGYRWGPGASDFDIRERNRYSTIAYIVMGRGAKPEGEVAAYDARQVQTNLGPTIVRPDQS